LSHTTHKIILIKKKNIERRKHYKDACDFSKNDKLLCKHLNRPLIYERETNKIALLKIYLNFHLIFVVAK
jgi:hypothetical protein